MSGSPSPRDLLHAILKSEPREIREVSTLLLRRPFDLFEQRGREPERLHDHVLIWHDEKIRCITRDVKGFLDTS